MPRHAHADHRPCGRAADYRPCGRAIGGDPALVQPHARAISPSNTGLQPYSRIEAVNGVRISERVIAEDRLVITPPWPTRGGRADPASRASGSTRSRVAHDVRVRTDCGFGSIWKGRCSTTALATHGGGRAGHAAARGIGRIGVLDPGDGERTAAELRTGLLQGDLQPAAARATIAAWQFSIC